VFQHLLGGRQEEHMASQTRAPVIPKEGQLNKNGKWIGKEKEKSE